MSNLVIAIDGPASAGKSTVAKIIAKKMNYIYIDTGAMYRTATYLALKNHLKDDDEAQIVNLLKSGKIIFKQCSDGQHVFWNDEDITSDIRLPEIASHVSAVSALPQVRAYLVEEQQAYGKEGGVVMDGRDIGTTVFPNADVKIFLVASVDERAERRYKENIEKGIDCQLEALKEAIAHRDYLDSTRKVSPLTKASDAIEVDTTGIDIDGVVQKIETIIQEKQRASR